MKKIALILLLTMVTVLAAEAHKYGHGHSKFTISYQTFYNELSPYGDWVFTPDYGYVWRPYFEYPEAFRPYASNGHWVNTIYGWTWVSDYRWGWATFHYGRWDFDNYLGWVWIPGYEWAPAWVSWGSYGDYWGWAPLGPNINVQVSIGWYAPSPWWTFVPRGHFCSDNWNRYIYDRPVYVNNITHITNVYVDNSNNSNNWYYGPRVNDVEKYTGKRVRSMEVVDSQRPDRTGVTNNRLSVYRPAVEKGSKESRPSEYRNVEQVRKERGTVVTTNPRSVNPGENRTRDNRNVSATTNRSSENHTSTVQPATRAVTGSSNRTSDYGTKGSSGNTRITTGASTKNDSRNSAVTGENRVEPRTGNNRQVQAETRRENPVQAKNQEVITRNASANVSTRVEERVNNRTRNTEPARGNAGSSVSRKTEDRQAATVQPDRKTETRAAAPERSVRVENSRKAESSGENTSRTEEVKYDSKPERSSGVNPARR